MARRERRRELRADLAFTCSDEKLHLALVIVDHCDADIIGARTRI